MRGTAGQVGREQYGVSGSRGKRGNEGGGKEGRRQ